MKQKIIGTYYCGSTQIQVVLREGTGGEFYNTPEKGLCPRIKIGADYNNWWELVNVALHEIMEYFLNSNNHRYYPDNDVGRDLSSFVFFLNHPQFSDIIAKSAEFLSDCLPVLEKEWKLWKRNKKVVKKIVKKKSKKRI